VRKHVYIWHIHGVVAHAASSLPLLSAHAILQNTNSKSSRRRWLERANFWLKIWAISQRKGESARRDGFWETSTFSAHASETIIIPKYHCAAVTPRGGGGVDAQSIVNFHMHDISNHESGKTHYLRSSKPFYLKTRRVFKKPSLKFTKKIRKCRQALIWCAAACIIEVEKAAGGIITTGFGTSSLCAGAKKKRLGSVY
jgi:hypothetical protein